jgi:streptogramin lyase
LWFTNYDNGSIGRITTAGVVTAHSATSVDGPDAIAVGPDRALWFADVGNGGNDPGSIGRITTAGVISTFTSRTIDEPLGITAGSDGAMWFTNSGNNSIGRITTAGSESGVITSPDSADATVGSPLSFTVTTTGTAVPSIRKRGKLPKPLTFVNNHDGTATISGTPTEAGVYSIALVATFGKGTAAHTATQRFTLTVSSG